MLSNMVQIAQLPLTGACGAGAWASDHSRGLALWMQWTLRADTSQTAHKAEIVELSCSLKDTQSSKGK